MDGRGRSAVQVLMERMSEGDRTAAFELYAEVGDAVRGTIARIARGLNAVHLSREDLDALALDVCMELLSLSRSWDPAGGALPWVWARQRVTGLVHQHLGQFTREIEESHLEIEEPVAVTSIEEPRLALRALAGRHEGAERLDRRLAEVVRDRDADIWLGFQLEKAGGNRSPAVTVAADYGMRPDAVRKVVQRVGERLGPDAIAA